MWGTGSHPGNTAVQGAEVREASERIWLLEQESEVLNVLPTKQAPGPGSSLLRATVIVFVLSGYPPRRTTSKVCVTSEADER